MSGSGGGRDDYVPPVAVGIGLTGDKPGTGDDPCAIVQTAPLNSPNPAIVSTLSVGEVLDVAVGGTPQQRVLEVRRAGGLTAGSLTHRGHLALIACIDAGNVYRAEVLQRTGGVVVVRIERA